MKRFDLWILSAIAGLCVFGFFNIAGIKPELVKNYVLFVALGWIVFIFTSRARIPLIEQNYKLLYVIFIGLFLVTFLIGSRDVGSTRWIPIFSFRFQTSEFFKPVLLLALASILSSSDRYTPRKIGIVLGLFGLPFVLVFLQPNLSSALIYLATFLTMFYFSGLSTRAVARTGMVAALCMPIVWFLMKEYQKARIIGFMNPNIDPQGLTYNINQSIISIGSGGFLGKGLGLGTQSRFHFLPEYHTDFAFASLVEQFGFIGGLAVLVLFSLLIARLVQKIFASKNDSFVYMYLIGTVAMLMIEITINVGMNMGLLPVTGIALPFISYGGSSILSTMIMLGLAVAM